MLEDLNIDKVEVEYFDDNNSKYYELEFNCVYNKYFRWTSNQCKFKIKNLYKKNSLKLVFENNPVNELITILLSNRSYSFIVKKNEMCTIDLEDVLSDDVITLIVNKPFIPIEETQTIDDRNLGIKFYEIVVNNVNYSIDNWSLSEVINNKLFVKKSTIYLVEGDNKKFIWTRDCFECLLTNYSPFKKFKIYICNDGFINKEFKVFLNDQYYKTFNFDKSNDKLLVITVPIHKEDVFLRIESIPFIPKESNIGSNDERILGFRFEKIELSFGNLIEIYELDKIKYLTLELFDKCKLKTTPKFNNKKILDKNVAVLCHIPTPENYTDENDAFLKNISKYTTFSDLITFSEFPWPNTIRVEKPRSLLKQPKSKSAVWMFYKCLEIAKDNNIEYFILIECDCRVQKDNWDYEILYNAIHSEAITTGTLVFSNINKTKELVEFAKKSNSSSKNGIYLSNFKEESLFWTNGAFATYHVPSILKYFNNEANYKDIEKLRTYDFDPCKFIIQDLGIKKACDKIKNEPSVVSFIEKDLPLKEIIDLSQNKIYNCYHPIKTNWMPKKDSYKFYHSGDLGDIIYSLPSIMLCGGGELILGKNRSDTLLSPREKMNKDKFDFLNPLLSKLKYITNIIHDDDYNYDEIDYDFNKMRTYLYDYQYLKNNKIKNLAECYTQLVGLRQFFKDDTTWIDLNKNKVSKYIVSRSFRYRDNNFPWKTVYEFIKNDSYFVGTIEEHEDFVKNFGYIPRYIVKDALDMTEIINGCDCFIGNQSFPMSLAIAQGKNVLQEYWPDRKDCFFSRKNLVTKDHYFFEKILL